MGGEAEILFIASTIAANRRSFQSHAPQALQFFYLSSVMLPNHRILAAI